MTIYTQRSDVSWQVSGEWPGSLTQAKPNICVPLLQVLCTVNEIVALKESIANAEDYSSEKEGGWIGRSSSEK